ncbi:hypothetical protein HK099_005547 [Clydaea vesicula]|uniref:Uncharacterized protein n=1 Tax=Clydaea vesicula TaxID=447962 RepID=A0AAD5TZ15_9FUNG|nr:hypothetical protein HK099_005547 [Clydaea vesicula]KAJ3397103.1 hypothetical protein HDU92_000803 [Lobulomyces angularis]
MAFCSLPWKSAEVSDQRFKYYIDHFKHYWPMDRLKPILRTLIYNILNPNPVERFTIKNIIEDGWFKEIVICHDESLSEEENAKIRINHNHNCVKVI